MELERCSGRRAFLQSVLTGFLFFAGTLWWVGHVTVPGMGVLTVSLALYFGVWGVFAHKVLRELGAKNPHRSPISELLTFLSLPAAWVVLEYVRSFLLSGFGWNLLAHTQWNWISLIQFADTTGVWGVSFLVVLVNVALFQLLKRQQGWRISVGVAVLCLLGAAAYGAREQKQFDARAPVPGFKVALLQGNIPQTQKWDEAYQEAIWKRYELLTTDAAAQKPNLIVWPETSVPGFLEDEPVRRRLSAVLASAGSPVLVGVPTEDLDTGELHNSAVLFSPAGVKNGRYDKLHLVPFGEYVPLKPLFGWLNNIVPIGDFSAGKEFTVFRPEPPVQPFSVLICFEDLFPGMSRNFSKSGARWLLVITNDGWFGRSAASLQHLQCSVFRAVEGRVWIARAANTGWTGFIDPLGRQFASIPRFKPGVAVGDLPVSGAGRSPYVRWGDWFPLFCLGLAVWAIMKPSK